VCRRTVTALPRLANGLLEGSRKQRHGDKAPKPHVSHFKIISHNTHTVLDARRCRTSPACVPTSSSSWSCRLACLPRRNSSSSSSSNDPGTSPTCGAELSFAALGHSLTCSIHPHSSTSQVPGTATAARNLCAPLMLMSMPSLLALSPAAAPSPGGAPHQESTLKKVRKETGNVVLSDAQSLRHICGCT